MTVVLLGYKTINYVSKKTGKPVNGVECHMMQTDHNSKYFVGNPVISQYIAGLDDSKLVVGEEYEVIVDVSVYNGQTQVRYTDLIPS